MAALDSVKITIIEAGMHAGGNVTKMGADFIGMTVLGTLNAAIGRQNIRAELSYSHQVRYISA